MLLSKRAWNITEYVATHLISQRVSENVKDKILQGDVLAMLKTLPDSLVDCVVTSPPYWGLRDYGSNGQMGLEPTLEEYIGKMTEVFREVRRVLKDTGTLWLNMGDGYSLTCPNKQSEQVSSPYYKDNTRTGARHRETPGLRPKNLLGQPWRLAFALQADGWYLRSDIIWAKPNPMPESVSDRPTKSHEYVFLMSKRAKYFYDADAVREPHQDALGIDRFNKGTKHGQSATDYKWDRDGKPRMKQDNVEYNPAGRNRRTVWNIATQAFPSAHFATFPEKLVEPCIRAGTSECGYCAECGLPWVRVTARDTDEKASDAPTDYKTMTDKPNEVNQGHGVGAMGGGHKRQAWLDAHPKLTIGWQPTCACSADTVPGLVLDPFMGSGTVALVVKKLDRNYLGIELNPEYIELSNKRLQQMALFL